jgi:predicted DNA-binding WGR domain protein
MASEKNTGLRKFQNTSDDHHKFWHIWKVNDLQFTTHWGAIGTIGSSNTKTYSSSWKMDEEYHKLIDQKKSKGYLEIDVETAVAEGKPILLVDNPSVEKPIEKVIEGTFPVARGTGTVGQLEIKKNVWLTQTTTNRYNMCSPESGEHYWIEEATVENIVENQDVRPGSFLQVSYIQHPVLGKEETIVALGSTSVHLTLNEWGLVLSWMKQKDKTTFIHPGKIGKKKTKEKKTEKPHKFSLADIFDLD